MESKITFCLIMLYNTSVFNWIVFVYIRLIDENFEINLIHSVCPRKLLTFHRCGTNELSDDISHENNSSHRLDQSLPLLINDYLVIDQHSQAVKNPRHGTILTAIHCATGTKVGTKNEYDRCLEEVQMYGLCNSTL